MDMRTGFALMLWLLLSPIAAEPAWRPSPDMVREPAAFAAPHSRLERLHERLLPPVTLDWRRPHKLAMDMFCDLGLIALALVDCDAWAALDVPSRALPSVRPQGGGGLPDRDDLNRRTVEERRRSI